MTWAGVTRRDRRSYESREALEIRAKLGDGVQGRVDGRMRGHRRWDCRDGMGGNLHDFVCQECQFRKRECRGGRKDHLRCWWKSLKEQLLQEGCIERHGSFPEKGLHVTQEFCRSAVAKVFSRQKLLEALSLGSGGTFEQGGLESVVLVGGGRCSEHIDELGGNFLGQHAHDMPKLAELGGDAAKCKLAVHLQKPHGGVVAPERWQANGVMLDRRRRGAFDGKRLSGRRRTS